jgi:hypothetical protein
MEKDKSLKNELRKRHLTHLITESVILALYEQEQMQIQPPPPAVNAPASPQEMAPQPTPENLPPPAAEPPQATQATVTLDTIIERLNVIRGGKSFTDPEVYGLLTTYFKNMNDDNKQTVLKFLQEVSKIVTHNAPEQQEVPSGQEPNVPPQSAPVQPPITPQAQTAPATPAAPPTPGV